MSGSTVHCFLSGKESKHDLITWKLRFIRKLYGRLFHSFCTIRTGRCMSYLLSLLHKYGRRGSILLQNIDDSLFVVTQME